MKGVGFLAEQNDEIRLGRQTPTKAVVLPYDRTLGRDAIDLYNTTGRTAQPWQELMEYDIMAVEKNGLWVHSRFGYAVPRRNGKNEVVAIRELYALRSGERVLHTAHRTTTSHAAWERLINLLSKSGLREGTDYKTTKQYGLERIDMLITDGTVSFRTRSTKGGLGEGFDLLIIDEAQEYTNDQESALKYVVSDSRNPQTIFCGTPPTLVSSGTVFAAYRKDVLRGLKDNAGWAEWSVPDLSDIRDKDLWYETNPSLGTILSERSVQDEIGEDTVDFNIQRLGHWLRYNQKSAISRPEWMEMQVDALPALEDDRYFAVKFGHDGTNISLSVAAKAADGKIFVECIDCSGFVHSLYDAPDKNSAGIINDCTNVSSDLASGVEASILYKKGHIGQDVGHGCFIHIASELQTFRLEVIREYNWEKSGRWEKFCDYTGATND